MGARPPFRAWPLALLAGAALAQGDMAAPSRAGAGVEPTERPRGPAVPELPWLQIMIDATPEGGTLRLQPGRYSGPALITRRITIDGQGRAEVTGGGTGTVLTLEASGSRLAGLRLTGSGDSHDRDDACLNLRGDDNVVEDLVLDDCLFGVDLKSSSRNVIRNNRIRSKDAPLGLRGDGLRLWYSRDNLVEGNLVTDSRDMVVWYSDGNVFRGNVGRNSRYSIHFMFATANTVEDNHFLDNSVGIYIMYTEGVVIRRNRVARSVGPAGMGIGFKEASDTTVEDNDIIYCAIGISSDLSPYQPDSTNRIVGNRVAYNGVGLTFTGDKTGTTVADNLFEGNILPVAQSGGGGALNNTWRGNYWDDYQGFDRDHDGVGDTPYELYAFTDQIWAETPDALFFRHSPLMAALDFLERLAPFSAPDLVVRDEAPRFVRPAFTERGEPTWQW